MTKSSQARLERRGKKLDVLKKAYENGYRMGVNMIVAQLASPEGVKMHDGRTARIVYDAPPDKDKMI